VYSAVGGVAGLAAAHGLPPGYWNIFYSVGPGSGWKLLALFGPAFMMSPGLLQKAYGAEDERAVRRGIGAQAVFLMLFSFIPVFFGVSARILHPDIASQNLVLPAILVRELPPWLGALGLAAVFSAEVSTCDAILFMLSTSLSQDLYKRFVNPDADDRKVLFAARAAAVVGGAAGVWLAIQLATIVGALSIFYSLVGVSLFVPVIAGLISRRGGAPEALASICAGVATLLAVQLATEGRGFGLLNPNLLGLIAAAAGFVLVFLARVRRAPAEFV
jgi:SSS family solute:Na+ symporter